MDNIQPHQHYMHEALNLAQQAYDSGEVPIGAVVVYQGNIIGRGYNQVIQKSDPSAHAEVVALRDAAKYLGNYRLPQCDLYVTLEPCTMCAGAMIHARIRHLYYATNEPKAGVIASRQQIFELPYFNHVVRATGGILADESKALIQRFFKARRQR